MEFFKIKRSLSQADGSEEKISQKVTVVNLPIYHEPISPAVGAVGIIQRAKRVSSNVVQDHIEQPQCFLYVEMQNQTQVDLVSANPFVKIRQSSLNLTASQ